MVYTFCFFSSKRSLFHNSNIFVSCIFHILHTGCAKIKKNNSGAKRLNSLFRLTRTLIGPCSRAGDPHNGLAKALDMTPYPLVCTDFSKVRSGLLLGLKSSGFLD